MRVLIVSTYELGHQPVHAASPAAALQAAGHEVHALDLAVEMWDPDALDHIDALAFSVPMHTAMRIAVSAAQAARRTHPDVPICFYGLYGEMAPALDPSHPMDRALAGEYEPELVAWVDALAGANGTETLSTDIIQLTKHDFHAPARELLPPIDRYARLAVDGEERLAGYVEASHGCVHKCRHCPVPVVYDGRIRIVGADTVLDDIARLVDAGARHITFGDPDFLNGWRHSRKVVRAMHARFPDLTFDCTTKVEHILEHAHVWPEFADAGCLFVISAFESLNDGILERLDKGHRRRRGRAGDHLAAPPRHRDAAVLAAVHAVDHVHRRAGHPRFRRRPRPGGQRRSGAVRHPAAAAEGVAAARVARHAAPPGGVRRGAAQLYVAGGRSGGRRAASGARGAGGGNGRRGHGYRHVLFRGACGRARRCRSGRRGTCAWDVLIDAERAAARPRLTEAWFCCAEPTELQFAQLAGI